MSVTIREGALACRVLPVVYATILDHAMRKDDSRAIGLSRTDMLSASKAHSLRSTGTLLGVVSHDTVEITNCFPVPHNETEHENQPLVCAPPDPSRRSVTLLHCRSSSTWTCTKPCLSSTSA